MDAITIRGYKSIRDATVELRPINILIGANGAGKSNFLSFFDFLNNLYQQKLKEYVALSGGADKMLFQGSKVTTAISLYLSLIGQSTYSFTIKPGESSFVFTQEELNFSSYTWQSPWFSTEANVKNADFEHSEQTEQAYHRAVSYLQFIRKYHFHDTGKNSPFTQLSHIKNDTYFLYQQGQNLAAFLYGIRETNPTVYRRIIKTIQSTVPTFSSFFFQPNAEGYVRLQWTDQYSEQVYGPTDFSDGTIRFIALATLLLHPNARLSNTLIIDEPELGLHPTAIAKLAGMMKSAASRGTQVIVATQSTDLISYFSPEDIITVDMEDGASTFNRLSEDDWLVWLEEYSLGDLWKRSIIAGGQP